MSEEIVKHKYENKILKVPINTKISHKYIKCDINYLHQKMGHYNYQTIIHTSKHYNIEVTDTENMR